MTNVYPSRYLLLPYAVEHWSEDQIELSLDAAGAARANAPFPCLLIDRARPVPLRFNNSRYDVIPTLASQDDGEPDLLSILRDQIKQGCDPWNRTALAFIDRYLKAVEETLICDEVAIARGTVGLGSLYSLRDWIFSAPRPLPRAHVPTPDGTRVLVDFAFWNGRNFIAIDLASGALLPRQAREREHRLRQAGAEIVNETPATPAGWAELMSKLTPLGAFWPGETLPLGPFRSDSLDELDRYAAIHL